MIPAIIGLTGGIGCGKSTVADLFARHGAPVIDTDLISHQLTAEGGAALSAIVTQFGPEYINKGGALDRTRMRQAIFSDRSRKQQLEAILHPLILDEVRIKLSILTAFPYVLVVVPLLFNSPAYLRLVQRILVVDCRVDQQVERVMARSGLSEAEVLNIISQQTSREERLRLADDVIGNDGDLAALAVQVERLHMAYFSAKTEFGD